MRNIQFAGVAGAALAACILSASSAKADDVEQFYKSRPLEILVGYGPGGGYDVYARHLARHITRFIPGKPTVVVRNMPGAGSLVLANHLYNAAPKDGSTFGIFARDMALSAILKANKNIRFDPRKFGWIGTPASAANDVYLTFARKDAKVKSVSDIVGKGEKVLVLGGTGLGSAGNDWALLLRDGLGLRIKLIPGYRGSAQLFVAAERGEIDGRSLDYSAVRSSRPDWLKSGSPMRVLLQFGRTTRHPDFTNVPLARDFADTPRKLALLDLAELSNTLSRPFAAPPGVPADRLAALRKAFDAMGKDAAYIAEGKKLRVDISPMSGKQMLAVIEKLAAFPEPVREQMRKIRSANKKPVKKKK